MSPVFVGIPYPKRPKTDRNVACQWFVWNESYHGKNYGTKLMVQVKRPVSRYPSRTRDTSYRKPAKDGSAAADEDVPEPISSSNTHPVGSTSNTLDGQRDFCCPLEPTSKNLRSVIGVPGHVTCHKTRPNLIGSIPTRGPASGLHMRMESTGWFSYFATLVAGPERGTVSDIVFAACLL
jgi:hypothetical protein